MPIVRELLVAEGVHCYRCVEKIAGALQGVDGLALASATPTGEVTIGYDEGREDVADAVVAALAGIGFPVVDRRAG